MIHRWRVFAGCPISQEAIGHGVALPRRGFSLLEMIIAIAILAASAMVLSSLIGLGAKYGNKAEERTHSLLQSQAMLDEWIARLPQLENQSEVTGELPSFPPRSYRIKVEPFQFGGNEDRPSIEGPSTEGQEVSRQGALVLVTMELLSPGKVGKVPRRGSRFKLGSDWYENQHRWLLGARPLRDSDLPQPPCLRDRFRRARRFVRRIVERRERAYEASKRFFVARVDDCFGPSWWTLGGRMVAFGTYKNAEERGWKLAHRVQTMRSVRSWLENDAVHMVPVSADPSTTPVHGVKGKFQGSATGFTVTIAPSVNPIGFFEQLMSPSQENAVNDLSTPMGTEDDMAALEEPPSLWPEDSIQIEYRIQSMGAVSRSSDGMLPSETQYEQFSLIRKENDSSRRGSSARTGTQGLGNGRDGNAMPIGDGSFPSERLLSGSDLYRQAESMTRLLPIPSRSKNCRGCAMCSFTTLMDFPGRTNGTAIKGKDCRLLSP